MLSSRCQFAEATEKKSLIFLSSNAASNSNNKPYNFSNCSCRTLVETESGEIERFYYKYIKQWQICFKELLKEATPEKQPFICWAIVFDRSTTGFDETKFEKFNWYLPVKNNLLLYLIKQLFYSTVRILAYKKRVGHRRTEASHVFRPGAMWLPLQRGDAVWSLSFKTWRARKRRENEYSCVAY